MNAPVASWVHEHGAEYAVPDVITRLEGIHDYSWHNDVCPRFGVALDADAELTIWADHPDPDQREHPRNPRFMLTFWGDSPEWWAAADAVGLEDVDGCEPIAGSEDEPMVVVRAFVDTLVALRAARRAIGDAA